MAVVGDKAYVLVDHRDLDGRLGSFLTGHHMEMFVLDLQTWEWAKLPLQDAAPWCASEIAPTVVQVIIVSVIQALHLAIHPLAVWLQDANTSLLLQQAAVSNQLL